MSDRYDKDILEQMNFINEDARNIEISDKIKPENMMKRIEEMERDGYFEGIKETNKAGNVMDKNKTKKKKRLAMFTGIGGTIVAASLTAVLLVQQPVMNSVASLDVTSVYSDKMRVETSDGIYVLSGYKELNEYIVAMETKRENEKNDYKGEDQWGIKGDGGPSYDGSLNDEVQDDVIMENFGGTTPEGEHPTMAPADTPSEGERPTMSPTDTPEDNDGTENKGEDEEYSDTNVRTEGVAEADIVKTDGKYIYYLGCKDNTTISLSIVEAKGADSKKVAELPIGSKVEDIFTDEEISEYFEDEKAVEMEIMAAEMIVSGDTLILVVQPYVYEALGYLDIGYFNDYSYETQYPEDVTIVMSYDITDRTAPKLLSTLTLEGEYDSCKMVNGYVYVFAQMYNYSANSLYEHADCTEEQAAKIYAPKICGELLPAEDVYVADCEIFDQYHIIGSIDMNDTSKFYDVKAFLGESSYVNKYVSANNIYIITDMQNEYRNELNDASENETITVQEQSEILRFSYENGNVTPNGKVIVNGSVGDEFDIDEYNGYLRMAVSTYSSEISYRKVEVEYYNGADWIIANDWTYDTMWSGSTEGSALYVYDENLQLVGSIPQLKENEQVYGVRFDGDIAYVVTYEQMDPLFTIDLSDPTNPTVMGALKIPGFSTYLHKWDDNKLIGLGYDENSFVKVSTFDITDKYDVKETEVYSLEGVYWSEALYNHKAIFISPEKNLIGFAIEDYYCADNMTDYKYGTVYKIFSYVDGKLTEVISCPLTNFAYDVRGLYIGDYIYIVSADSGAMVYDMEGYSNVACVE